MLSLGSEPEEPRSYVYKEIDGRSLELHVFEPSDHSEPAPAIVWYHGGGWREGKAGQFFEHGKILAKRGMFSISVDYRGYAGDRTNRDIAPCIEDAKSAFRWVVTHAKELGIDPDRIAAGGGSAGAHLAASLATLPGFNAVGEDISVSTIPRLAILFNPAVGKRDRIATPDSDPTDFVNEKAPQSLILHGIEDTTVPISDAYLFQDKLKSHGIDCRVIAYEGQGHAFFNYDDGGNPYYYKTVGDMLLYLEEQAYLKK